MPSDSTKDNEGAAEVVTVAEVEVVESRGRNHGRAVTEKAVGLTQASTACDSTLALATEKDTVRSTLGERTIERESLSAKHTKNADANNRAYYMNQKQHKPWTPWRRSKVTSKSPGIR